MNDEDLHDIERMLDRAPATGEVSLILPGGKAVSCHVYELGLVFSQAALFRKLRPTLSPSQVVLGLTPDKPPA